MKGPVLKAGHCHGLPRISQFISKPSDATLLRQFRKRPLETDEGPEHKDILVQEYHTLKAYGVVKTGLHVFRITKLDEMIDKYYVIETN
jgi:hypothetical protein